jgi:ribosome-associated protein
MKSETLARLAASLLVERKGEDVVVLEMAEVLPLTDYFVIATGGSARHVDALCEAVEMGLKAEGFYAEHRSGRETKTWILLDYGWVVVHIFQEEAREYYDLELLWGDAKHLVLDAPGDAAPDAES